MRSILSLRPNSSLLLSHGYHDCSQAQAQAQAAGPPLVSRIAKKKNFSLFAVGGRRTPREEGRGEERRDVGALCAAGHAGCRSPSIHLPGISTRSRVPTPLPRCFPLHVPRSLVHTLWCAGLYLAAATTTLVVLGYAVRVQPFWLDKVGTPPQSAEEASSPSA